MLKYFMLKIFPISLKLRQLKQAFRKLTLKEAKALNHALFALRSRRRSIPGQNAPLAATRSAS